jgi:hypothetical protein
MTRLKWCRAVSAFLCLLPTSVYGAEAGETWNFDNVSRIGGHETTVLGHPHVIDSPVGKAIEFNGVDDGIMINVHPLAGAETFTWEAIFRPDGGNAEQRWFHLEQNPATGSNADNRMLFEIRVVNGKWCLDAFDKTGTNSMALLDRNKLHDLGRWYHVAAVYDGKEFKSYVNGREEGSGKVHLDAQGEGRTSIGVRMNRVFYFKGAVAQARFTRRALSPSEFVPFSQGAAQTASMRTRYLPSLTNPEIEQYLKRNDVIFIPVGTVETFGTMPSDMEYRMAEAYAVKMAEEVDGLILPHAIYFYPGVTVTGRASVYVPEDASFAYLKAIAHSLLRQGFRRQIYLSAHGPSDQFVSGMVRQFFEETKDPILYIHLPLLNRRAGAFRSIGYGAYYILGRMNDIPLTLDPGKPDGPPLPPPPASMRLLTPLAPESSAVGSYDPDAEHNGGRPLEAVKMTAAERERLGKEGAALIEANEKAVNIRAVLAALRDEDKYVHEVILPRYKDVLPADQP